jgi:hypothetical protein
MTTAKQLDSEVGVAKDPIRKQLTEASDELRRTNSPVRVPPPRMDATPPALVVITDSKEEEFSEAPPRMISAEGKQDKSKVVQDSREATPPSNHSPSTSAAYHASPADKGRNEVGSLQSMQVTSAGGHGRDISSSEEEELGEVEFVYVDDEGMEAGERERLQRMRKCVVKPPAEGVRNPNVGTSPEVGGGMGEVSSHRNPVPPNAVAVNGSNEMIRNGHSSVNENSRSNKPSLELGSPSRSVERFHRRNKGEGEVVRTVYMTNAKQAAKVKQFFTTLQQHANKLGSEVAEQVQELIHALMVSGEGGRGVGEGGGRGKKEVEEGGRGNRERGGRDKGEVGERRDKRGRGSLNSKPSHAQLSEDKNWCILLSFPSSLL